MKKLQSKITFTYVALTFVVVAAVGGLSSAKMESYFKDQLVAEVSSRADLMILLLRRESTSSPEEADRRLKELSRVANLRITLIDSAGVVLLDSDVPYSDLHSVENHLHRPEVQSALRQGLGTDTRHSATVGKDFMYVARRLEPSIAVGMLRNARFIRLSQHLEDVQAIVKEIRWSTFAVGCGVLLLVLAVSVFICRRVASPMVAIAKGAEEIRSGNLDARLDVQSNDEIGQVARAVNEMVDRLKVDIAQLKKLERVRSEFLGNVSHELRTPIFTLQGYLETLLNGAIDDPTVNRSFVEKCSAHAARLNSLLNDLIDISRIESGEMKMSFRYFRINEFLETVTGDFQQAALQRHVKLVSSLGTSSNDEAFGDKERLREVMSNLIDNAIKYNRDGGEVRVRTERGEGKVRITVADTGVGIGEEHLSRIFERFYRIDKDRSREVGGTGLGLAIVKHIVEAHESKVEVQSTVGKGTSFSFTLKS